MSLLALLSAPALAHVGLDSPPPRYPTDGFSANKSCPCGGGANDQYCSNSTLLSDPNRSTNVTAYAAGQTITVRAYEVVGHSGRWRIAFDPDGADLADFNATILLDEPDPPGDAGNVGQGNLWEWTVTLPNVNCANCTLQLIQMMDGNQTDPVPDPTGRSSYYQCADLELTGGTVDTGTPGTSETGTGTTTDPTGPTGTGGTDTETTDTDTTDTDTTDGTDSGASEAKGCGCDGTGGAPGAALALGLLAFVRRRR